MRSIARGTVVIALCSMATSCARPDGANPERPATNDRAAAVALDPELGLLRQDLADRLSRLGAPQEDLQANLDLVTEAALKGEYAADATEAILASLAEASPEDANKAADALDFYAESVMQGEPVNDAVDPGAALGTLALCNSCTTAVNIAAASPSCQYVSGNTTAACPSDYYRVSLPANSACYFTFCRSGANSCTGSSGPWDTRIRAYTTACSMTHNNDDFCGLQSHININTGAAPETRIVEVTGFTTSNWGTYTLGYFCSPTCPSTTGTLGVPQTGKASWMVPNRLFRDGVPSGCGGKTCPGTFSTGTSPRAYDRWDQAPFPTPTCVTVNMTSTTCSGSMVHPIIYRGILPTGSTSNCSGVGYQYLGDSGSSIYPGGPAGSASATIPAGTPWSIVVQGANSNQTGCSYTWNRTPCPVATPCPDCQACIDSVTPSGGNVDSTSCSRRETFTVNFRHNRFSSTTVNWTITPPAGGSASPASGSISVPAGVSSVNFSSLLNRANCPASGNFNVNVTATKASTCNPTEPNSTLAAFYSLSDTTPPVFGPQEDICLWPPNHEVLCQDALDLRSVTDNCGNTGIVMGAEACQSNEADEGLGDGNTTGDCVIGVDDVTGRQIVCNRAERSGLNPDGRAYTVSGRARDACGNFTPSTTLQVVSVPHDQSEHPECIAP